MTNRELDELIATNVLGWGVEGCTLYDIACVDKRGDGKVYLPFSPSQNMEDAWVIVRHLQDQVDFFDLTMEEGEWYCEFGKDYSGVNEVKAKTAAMAICIKELNNIAKE